MLRNWGHSLLHQSVYCNRASGFISHGDSWLNCMTFLVLFILNHVGCGKQNNKKKTKQKTKLSKIAVFKRDNQAPQQIFYILIWCHKHRSFSHAIFHVLQVSISLPLVFFYISILYQVHHKLDSQQQNRLSWQTRKKVGLKINMWYTDTGH